MSIDLGALRTSAGARVWRFRLDSCKLVSRASITQPKPKAIVWPESAEPPATRTLPSCSTVCGRIVPWPVPDSASLKLADPPVVQLCGGEMPIDLFLPQGEPVHRPKRVAATFVPGVSIERGCGELAF